MYFLGVPVVIFGGYQVITDHLVTVHDEKIFRNQETGIIPGAEPLVLGPEESSRAALLVHGFAGTGNNFNELPQRLASLGWYVRVMSLPGHGTSPRDLEKVTADSMIQAVRDELDGLSRSHSSVVLVGHSMGGTIAALVAVEKKVDCLVLCAPYFGVTYKWYYILTAETWTHIAYPVIRWVHKSDIFVQVNRKEVKNKIVSYRWIPLHGVKILLELGCRANEPEVLHSITCPVLLLHSKSDDAASWKCSKLAFEALHSIDKRVVWLNTSNHLIFWDYEHEKVYTDIEHFLSQQTV
ncbi:MAG TPA: alpha/beta fold hydrolase, partial [Anaerolineae bacterium]|nr:alpha/beta fold hydrolase [Anaerolineae bacterium]